ncbi:hypothetical protein SLW70_07400 [Flavobacterium sp. NG2]|uniref:hypothetical protein n=1 Tax=Flavobacterium sp. NG2 TaxID=3097547 RepID=UPI002A7F6D5C|nr:hypothetical protein [Flavobacterium sp. NG2]WPR72936.1 hypothetical protein SLW70_07400 [Flavobacterium sp. NG2]
MKYNYKLNDINTNYPIILIPKNIQININREIHYTEILKHINESYYPLSSRVYLKFPNFNKGLFKDDYSLSEYLNFEEDEIIFSLKDFYYSNPANEDYKLPRKPRNFKLVQIEKNIPFFIQLNIIVNIIISLITFKYSTIQNALYCLIFLCIITIIFIFFGFFKRKIEEKKYFDEIEFSLIIANFTEEVNKITSRAIEDYRKYKYNKLKKVETNREKAEKEIFYLSLKPELEYTFNQKIAVKGRTEEFFLEFLLQYFGNQIKTDIVPIEITNSYQPDFLLVCNKTGFYLVIEIDEPYSAENGQPIHHERTSDKEREDFFEELNWAMVKFSEKQIIKETYKCCELIENIIKCISEKKIEITHQVTPDQKWSYEEAIIMSKNNYRNTYLPNNLKINTNNVKSIKKAYDDDLPF